MIETPVAAETQHPFSSSNSIILFVIEKYLSEDESVLTKALRSLKAWEEEKKSLIEQANSEEKEKLQKDILIQIESVLKVFLFFKHKLPDIKDIEAITTICNEALLVMTRLLSDEYKKLALIPSDTKGLEDYDENNDFNITYSTPNTFDLDASFLENLSHWFCWEISSDDYSFSDSLKSESFVNLNLTGLDLTGDLNSKSFTRLNLTSKKSAFSVYFSPQPNTIAPGITIEIKSDSKLHSMQNRPKTYDLFGQTVTDAYIPFTESSGNLPIFYINHANKIELFSIMEIIKDLGVLDKITYEKLDAKFHFIDPFPKIIELVKSEQYDQAIETALSAEKNGFEHYVWKLAEHLYNQHIYDKALDIYISIKQNNLHYQNARIKCFEITQLALIDSDKILLPEQKIKYMEHALEILAEICEFGYTLHFVHYYPKNLESLFEKHRNSCFFIIPESKNSDEKKALFYIDFEGKSREIKINDIKVLQNKLEQIKINDNSRIINITKNSSIYYDSSRKQQINKNIYKIVLSSEEFIEIVTSNGEQQHFDVTLRRQRDLIFNQLRGNKGLTTSCSFEINIGTIFDLLAEIRELKNQLVIKEEKKEEKIANITTTQGIFAHPQVNPTTIKQLLKSCYNITELSIISLTCNNNFLEVKLNTPICFIQTLSKYEDVYFKSNQNNYSFCMTNQTEILAFVEALKKIESQHHCEAEHKQETSYTLKNVK